MATLVLSAAGAAIGSSVGGTLLGLSATAVGRFAGATLGRALDQRLLGQGAEAVETGRLDRIRLTGSGEGHPVARVFGRVRLGGHVIWASPFVEHSETSGGGGGKGAPPQPKVRRFSYSVSLAVALCEGEILGVSRVWADGVEIPVDELTLQVYRGTQDQMPDPRIEASEGVGRVPAFRGTAYVVIEDLMLERFGNRVPQLSFEVTRGAQSDPTALHQVVRAVALLPGTGEYALASTAVQFDHGDGVSSSANAHSGSLRSDLMVSLDHLQTEAPKCAATSLIVSWFGDDLRCGTCQLRPMVEHQEADGSQAWVVADTDREGAERVPRVEDAPIYGGTPSDASVIQSIRALQDAGQAVMVYPFILMTQLADNAQPDPWTGAAHQPSLPWRGRITLSAAPGQPGSPDHTAQADAEVAAFFGSAQASDFAVSDGSVRYTGPEDWGFRRFILHNAALCAAAGGVDSFCIGSEMRGLTQIRGAQGFPAVAALCDLAAEVRALLGPDVKLGYAADWSEYFGYHPQDGSGDVYFHLDPLWADPNIDFIGIDNYMPLSDWRDGPDHADAGFEAPEALPYLHSQIEGGEGFDWYYPTPEARAAQRRHPITDGAHDEPWVYRYKDLRSWWTMSHHNRIGGQREAAPTDWIPRSKPIWFTELGCPAVDKGTNQPNKFLDPKSSESALPHFSNGARDEMIQHQYLRAMMTYWDSAATNPVSPLYDGPMVDLSRAFIWAWDARPYPWFPNVANAWSDGPNWRRGHWITGRTTHVPLADVVRELCAQAGMTRVDVSRLTGLVRGYSLAEVGDIRRALQPLMLAYGFDAVERDGVLQFQMRPRAQRWTLPLNACAQHDDLAGDLAITRGSAAEVTGRIRLGFTEADGDHAAATEETVLPDEPSIGVAQTDLSLTLTKAEARLTVERWLTEARVARDTARFALPMSLAAIGAGDVVDLRGRDGASRGLWRIDQVDRTTHALIEAVRIEDETYLPAHVTDVAPSLVQRPVPGPVWPIFLDLPLITGDDVPHAPHVAVAARPWTGAAAVYSAPEDDGYALDLELPASATIGRTQSEMRAVGAGRRDLGPDLVVKMTGGPLTSVTDAALRAGQNRFAIGDGTPDGWEVFQAQTATLIAPDTWALGGRLRGQFGTDGVMPEVWPSGSVVVALDAAVHQLPLAQDARGVARHYRVGPARAGYDSDLFRHQILQFHGTGLRPYRPAHLRAAWTGADWQISWIRRSRIDGALWSAPVPLGEDEERYSVSITQGGEVLQTATPTAPAWSVDSGMLTGAGVVEVSVAQISARYGPGPAARITLAPVPTA